MSEAEEALQKQIMGTKIALDKIKDLEAQLSKVTAERDKAEHRVIVVSNQYENAVIAKSLLTAEAAAYRAELKRIGKRSPYRDDADLRRASVDPGVGENFKGFILGIYEQAVTARAALQGEKGE